MKKLLLASLALVSMILVSCAPSADSGRRTVIFDTDMGNDVDDVMALQMLFNYHNAGLIDLKGITISKSSPNALPYVDGLCRFNGFPDMPLGFCYEAKHKTGDNYLVPALEAEYYGAPLMSPRRFIDSGVPDACTALRGWLAESRDASVSLIAVGPLQNIAALLESGPDAISKLNGVELVRKKVEGVYLMSGDYSSARPEFNVRLDIEAARTVYGKCPVKLVTSGWEVGAVVKYPHQSIMHDFGDPASNPLTVSYMAYLPMPYDRECWDLTAVFDAVENDGTVFQHSERGRISVADNGSTRFTADPEGLQCYLKVSNPQLAAETLVKRVTDSNFPVFGRTCITAHAGSCGTPANSLESISRAVSLNVDYVEMDVRRSPDTGALVIRHDPVGKGESATGLREALLLVKPSSCLVNLDVKETETFPELYAVLRELDMTDRVIMTGIRPGDLLKARSQMPGIPYYPAFEPSVKLSSDSEYVRAMVTFLKATGSEGINCHYSSVTPELAAALEKNSLRLSVWTVDSEEEMARIASYRPYNITTRHPDTVGELCRR